jgi:phage-related holin
MKLLDLDKIWAYAFAAVMGFLEPLWVMMLWFLIFVMVDFITGIYASLIEGKLITSNKMQKTVVKFITYATAIFLLHGIDAYLISFAKLYLARIGATLICGIELYSIFENMYRSTGNPVFKVLTQFTLKKIEEQTGVTADELDKYAKKTVRKGKRNAKAGGK